jgi:hypothetical protein
MPADKSTTESTVPKRRTAEWLAQQLTTSEAAVRALFRAHLFWRPGAWTFSTTDADAEASCALRKGLVKVMCRVAEVAIANGSEDELHAVIVEAQRVRDAKEVVDTRRMTAAWLAENIERSVDVALALDRHDLIDGKWLPLDDGKWPPLRPEYLTAEQVARVVQLARSRRIIRKLCRIAEKALARAAADALEIEAQEAE